MERRFMEKKGLEHRSKELDKEWKRKEREDQAVIDVNLLVATDSSNEALY